MDGSAKLASVEGGMRALPSPRKKDGRNDAPSSGRQQARTQDKCRLIRKAASNIIFSHGISGLTHRLVAKEAGLPLAATTYHFATKMEIIQAASQDILNAYSQSFSEAVDQFVEQGGSYRVLLKRFADIVRNSAGRSKITAICWGEIMLEASRHPADRSLRPWFESVIHAWKDIFEACDIDYSGARAIVAVDMLVGLVFLVVGLGLSERAVDKAFSCKNDLLDLRPSPSPFTDLSLPNRETAKALATRAKILVATIEILKSEGPGAVNGRSVAERAGLTKAAPFYYFPSIADLLSSAQLDLFRRSKDRYRQGLVDAGGFDVDLDHLIDRTATIFLREATEHAAENVANYSIWLRADGESLIGTRVWEVTADQHQSWRNVLRIWKTDLDPLQPLLAQALFIGKLVRVLASGSAVQDMSSVRRDFAFGLRDILSGFWSGTHKQYNLPK